MRDLVFLHFHPYRQSSLKQSGTKKMKPQFYGPYIIAQRVGEVAYELEIREHNKIIFFFHVSWLKNALGKHSIPSMELPPLDDEGNLVL